jgi:hypothetical protein
MSERSISERAKFYVQHRERIQEWAELKTEAEAATHDFYCSLIDLLESETLSLPEAPLVFAHLERTEPPKLFLYRSEWSNPSASEQHPRIGIGIEWPSKSPTFENACICVWVNLLKGHTAFGERARSLIASDAKGVVSDYALYPDKGWFPVYRKVKPIPGDYLDLLDEYANDLVKRICSLWIEANGIVHQAFLKTQENQS